MGVIVDGIVIFASSVESYGICKELDYVRNRGKYGRQVALMMGNKHMNGDGLASEHSTREHIYGNDMYGLNVVAEVRRNDVGGLNRRLKQDFKAFADDVYAKMMRGNRQEAGTVSLIGVALQSAAYTGLRLGSAGGLGSFHFNTFNRRDLKG